MDIASKFLADKYVKIQSTTQKCLSKILVKGFFQFFFFVSNERNMNANWVNISKNYVKAVVLKEITQLSDQIIAP